MEIKTMADVLLKGGKMLNRSCPECNAPLFKYQGRTFCAKCGWEEGRGPATEAAKAEAPEPKAAAPSPSVGARAVVPPESDEVGRTLAEAKRAVLQGISEYARKLSDQGERGNLSANTKALSDLMDLLEKIVAVEAKRA